MSLCYISILSLVGIFDVRRWTQKIFTFSKSTTETIEKKVKYVQKDISKDTFKDVFMSVWTCFTTFLGFLLSILNRQKFARDCLYRDNIKN